MECTCHGTPDGSFIQESTCALAIAAVPKQKWGELYDPQTALIRGTIFKELDLPFYIGGDSYAG